MVVVSVRLVPKLDCKLVAIHNTHPEFAKNCDWILEISGLEPELLSYKTCFFDAPGPFGPTEELHMLKSPDKKGDYYAGIPSTNKILHDIPIAGAMLYINKLQEGGLKIISSFSMAKEGGGTQSLIWTLQDHSELLMPVAAEVKNEGGHHHHKGKDEASQGQPSNDF